jgi:ADP-heptose:LPS heptosyltransferase
MTEIIINFPTNIGDVILGLPVLDRLKSNYPRAKITAIASLKTRDFLLRNTFINEVILFDKSWRPMQKLKFSLNLRGRYDMMVDLKNSFLPVLLGVRRRSPFVRPFSNKVHIEDKYLSVIRDLAPGGISVRCDFALEEEKKSRWDFLGISRAIVFACTSRSKIKRYPPEYIKEVIELLEGKHQIMILGVERERKFYSAILKRPEVCDLVGKTTMWDVFYLLQKYALLVVGVDSSITHMASYLDIPAVTFFGPTSYERSCPRSKHSIILRKAELKCLPCEVPDCRYNSECMKIEPRKVVEAINTIIPLASNMPSTLGKRRL